FRKNPVSKSHKMIHTLMSEIAVVDTWRLIHPTDHDYSFYSPPHRIDMIMVPNSFTTSIISAFIGYRLLLDHAPISISWSPSVISKTSKCWRLNSSLSNDKEFQTTLLEKKKKKKKNNMKKDQPWYLIWDTLKAFLRRLFISKASQKKSQNLLQKQLEKEILALEKKLQLNFSPDSIRELQNKKFELNKILTSRLKKLSASQIIPMINIPNSQPLLSPQQINKAFVSFYKELYSSQQDLDSQAYKLFFDKIKLPHLSSKDINWLDEPFT
uniref:Endonuclease/exonuclease/phosphatase domain-containing protein n=1 Tax=Latimeria chalumnae TaxID=7897 RepID=H3BB69_LATCH